MEETVVVNEKTYTKENIEEDFEVFKQAARNVVEALSEAMEIVGEFISGLLERIDEANQKIQENDFFAWYVPLDTTRPSQVNVSSVKLLSVRNHI